MTQHPISPGQTLAELAVTQPAAVKVLQHHRLDFCCHGQVSLEQACHEHGLDPKHLIREIEIASAPEETSERWDEQSLDLLIEHLLTRFHQRHREDVPRLIAMARRVESVHRDKASCPTGLAAFLEEVAQSLELHMQKEEQILFPMIRAGQGRGASMPVQVMEQEHRDHGENLARLRAMTGDFVAPPEACTTWRALYSGLAELEAELMQHIHLENNVLFPRALES